MTKAARAAKRKKGKAFRDKHAMYEAAVQSVEADVDFVERIYKKRNREHARLLREDFCGTASLACEWVRRRKSNRAIGVDLDGDTLAWGRKHRLATLGDDASRVTLHRQDVLEPPGDHVDVVVAFNFSYFVFRDRDTLSRYFKRARKSLRPGGAMVLDLFGGAGAAEELKEKSKKPAEVQVDGRKIPAFTYVWEQTKFNPVDHSTVCHISFELRDGTKMRRVFSYPWRIWTLPELRDLMRDAGFAESVVYVEGWDDDADESDGVFRARKRFDNQESWIAYLVGWRDEA